MSLGTPCSPEPDLAAREQESALYGLAAVLTAYMAHANAHPGEDCGQTRQCEEPIEDLVAVAGHIDVGDRTKKQNCDYRKKWTTRFIHIGEQSRGVSGLAQSSQGTRP
jgi:hypothetical protein